MFWTEFTTCFSPLTWLKKKNTTVADKLPRSLQDPFSIRQCSCQEIKGEKMVRWIKKREGGEAISSHSYKGAEIWC